MLGNFWKGWFAVKRLIALLVLGGMLAAVGCGTTTTRPAGGAVGTGTGPKMGPTGTGTAK